MNSNDELSSSTYIFSSLIIFKLNLDASVIYLSSI